MEYVPLFKNVLVSELKENDSKIIVFNEDQFARIIKAKVVAVSENKEKQVSTNDIVYFSLRNAKSINLNDKDYYVVDEEDILVKEKNG